MRKIIDLTLEQDLKNDVIGTVNTLRIIIGKIIQDYGDITDTTKEMYNAADSEYELKLSVSTIRNYLKNYRFIVKKDASEPIVHEMSFPEYVEIKKKLEKLDENTDINKKNEGDDFMDNLTTRQRISLAFGDQAAQMNEMTQMALRCDSKTLQIFSQLCADMRGFDKAFLLSYVISTGLKNLGYTSENVTQETIDAFYKTKKKKGE